MVEAAKGPLALGMHKLFALFIAMALHSSLSAQEKWTLCSNGTTFLTATAENEAQNVVKLTSKDIEGKGGFTLVFEENYSKGETERFLGLYSADDEELLVKSASTINISKKELRKYFAQNKTLKLLTWTLPTDPDLRSRIRIRRIHLCTLALQP